LKIRHFQENFSAQSSKKEGSMQYIVDQELISSWIAVDNNGRLQEQKQSSTLCFGPW
jgi:hypothetical protein